MNMRFVLKEFFNNIKLAWSTRSSQILGGWVENELSVNPSLFFYTLFDF